MALTGFSNRCPACRTVLWAPPSEPFGEKRCPRCGAELWVIAFSSGPAFFVRQPGESLADCIFALAGPTLRLSRKQIEAGFRGADSLDRVELLMEIEEALSAPDEEGSSGTPPGATS